MASSAPAPAPELEDELAAFRAQWRQEAERKRQLPPAPAASIPVAAASTSKSERHHQPLEAPLELARSPDRAKRVSIDADTDRLAEQIEAVDLEASPRAKDSAAKRADREREHERERERERELRERARPKSALELYEFAVSSEREGRMQDALVNYRSAFRLDPDVDRAYHLASVAAQKHSRGAEPNARVQAGSSTQQHQDAHEFRFERTLQFGPDYDSRQEHRTKEEAQRESGRADADSTHPSSTAFLLRSLLKSFAENPWVRPPPTVRTAGGSAHPDAPQPTSPNKAPVSALPRGDKALTQEGTVTPSATPEEALAALHFIPADEEQPLPLARLPYEVLLLVLRHLVLSSMLPPPRLPTTSDDPAATPLPAHKSKRLPRKRTLREEMQQLELELELEDVDREWKSDVEGLERFARVCRAARVVTLDSGIWRALCLRTYVPPQQISREENALRLVKSHGNDWRRFYIEHPRIRLDGTYISVVTYLRRGEVQSVYAPTHLVTFYRYLRFYHHGLVLSLLTTDPPGTVVRRFNPTLRMAGLSFGRWRLRGNRIDLWGLEDPSIPDDRKKYSFRMSLDLKSTARGKMNKLVMVSLATENRRTLEVEEVPIRPSKPFFFSKVAAYVGEERVDEPPPRQ
ncbi:hypothetical protein JCM8115_002854 [Rhodotorula mucilaginosa]